MSNSRLRPAAYSSSIAMPLAGLGQHLTEPVWQSLMAELRGCQGKIVVTGVGTSGIAARKVAHMLACVERPAIYLNATDAAHGDLGFTLRRHGDYAVTRGIRTSSPGCCPGWLRGMCPS